MVSHQRQGVNHAIVNDFPTCCLLKLESCWVYCIFTGQPSLKDTSSLCIYQRPKWLVACCTISTFKHKDQVQFLGSEIVFGLCPATYPSNVLFD